MLGCIGWTFDGRHAYRSALPRGGLVIVRRDPLQYGERTRRVHQSLRVPQLDHGQHAALTARKETIRRGRERGDGGEKGTEGGRDRATEGGTGG